MNNYSTEHNKAGMKLLKEIDRYNEQLRAIAQNRLQYEEKVQELHSRMIAARQEIEGSDDIRKAILLLPSSSTHIPSYESISEIMLSRFPSFASPARPAGPDPLGEWLLNIFERSEGQHYLNETEQSVYHFVTSAYGEMASLRYLKKPRFWKRVLMPGGYDGTKPVSLEAVYKRLHKFAIYLSTHKKDRLKEDHGSVWLDYDHNTRHDILLEISSEFPLYLAEHLHELCPNAYLDDIVLDPSVHETKRFKNKFENKNSSAQKECKPRIGSVDLRDRKKRLLGTVLTLDNYLSPDYIAEYIRYMDQSKFTSDGHRPTHPRGYRFASQEHATDGELPCWLLFGDNSSSSIILSQHTNPAEGSMLRIVNYIHFLYARFVNDKMEEVMGQVATEKWGLMDEPGGHFDSLMVMVSDPSKSNYGRHDDGKAGLCVPDEMVDGVAMPNKYSKFNLVVPTVTFQNHTRQTTEIKFYDKTDEKFETGRVTCSVSTIHIQLLGVQHYCDHMVSRRFLL